MKADTQRGGHMEIDLLWLASALWRRARTVLLVMALCGAAAFVCTCFFVTPLYEASALMYVNNSSAAFGGTSVSLSDLSASKTLVDTYIVILESRLTLNKVIEQAELPYSYEELREMVRAAPVNSTEIFEITVSSPDPAEAERIANTIAGILPEKISEIMDGSSVRVVDLAVPPASQSSPSLTKNVTLGLIAGLLLSCGVTALLELLDERVRDEAYLTQTYALPVLSAIPDLPPNTEKAVCGRDLSPTAAEAYKLLRTNLLFAQPDGRACRVVGVTSAGSGDGKSTTALNLSYMLAEAGKRTLLIEGDMRLPALSRQLELREAPGLSNVLAGLNDLKEALQESGLHKRLQVISSGNIPPTPSELLGGASAGDLIEALSGDYDFIVFDLPPAAEAADALVASRLTDGIIVVVRQNHTDRRTLADMMQRLRYVDARVLGFVMACAGTGGGSKYRR